jgi:structural maintenance of chromosome 4
LTKEIADGKEKVKSLEREIQVLKVKENGLEERLTRTREQNDLIQIDQEHLTELEEQVHLYEKEYEAAAEKTEELDKLVKGLHDEIMRRGESKIKPQQAHIDAIDKELKEASAGIVKSTAAIKNNSRNVKKCAEKLLSLEGNVEKITKNIEDMEIEMEELKKESNEIIQEKDMLDDKLKSLSETMLVMKKEIEGYEQELKGVNEQLLDMTHEMKQYSSKIKENQSKIKHFNNEIASLDLDDEDKKDYSEEDLVNINKEEVEYEITMLEEKLKKMSPNMKAIEEYKRKVCPLVGGIRRGLLKYFHNPLTPSH